MRERLFHLKPVFRPRYRVASGLLDVAPWIDTVLLALVFFIAASATLKKPGLSLNLPTARATSGARYEAHVLSVPADGVYYFAMCNQRMDWEGGYVDDWEWKLEPYEERGDKDED